MAGKAKPWPVDGQMMTTKEIAGMLGITTRALYNRRQRLGKPSYQLVVNIYRQNQFGSDKCRRYLIERRWLTRGQIAAELKIQPKTISTWRWKHRQSDGTPAPMADAVAYYRQYLTGELKRWHGYGGGRPCKAYPVGAGKTATVPDVMRRFGVSRAAVKSRLYYYGHDMGRVIESYERLAQRQKDRERERLEQAEKDILEIIYGGQS